MAGLFVDVELVVLVVVQEAAPLFEDGEVVRIALVEHVRVVSGRDLRLHFDHLPVHLRSSHRQSVAPPIYRQKLIASTSSKVARETTPFWPLFLSRACVFFEFVCR